MAFAIHLRITGLLVLSVMINECQEKIPLPYPAALLVRQAQIAMLETATRQSAGQRKGARAQVIDDRNHALPPWFTRPLPVSDWQRNLFQTDLRTVLVRLQVSVDEIARWHAKEWLSFDGADNLVIDEFRDPRIWELTIVRDIVRSGLSDAQVEYLLDQLPKPLAFDPDSLAFSFRHGWVEVSLPADPDPEEVIEEHLDSWLDDLDEDRLRELHARIGELLGSFEKDAQEGEE